VSGYITVASFSSSLVTSCLDWSGLAGLFLEYRVRALEVIFTPYYKVNTTALVPPAKLVICSWNAGTSPSTYNQLCDGTNSKVFDAREQITYAVEADTSADSPNMQWTGITGAPPSANTFGIAFGAEAAGPAFTVSAVWASYTYRVLVDFKYAG
jgi:hypothetical protein